jgi:hypothetical protein
MPNKTVHCKTCGAAISGSTFEERMAKLRRHYKKHHPAKFRKAIKKAIATKLGKNPAIAGAVLGKAKKLFKDFHDFDPRKVIKAKVKNRMVPKVLVVLGRLVDVSYSSDKWHKGKRVNYIHKFKQQPYLACSPGGDQLFIIGGSYKAKQEGIVG